MPQSQSTRDDTPTDPETPAEFRAALEALCQRAHENGIAVEGAWDIDSVKADRSWTVETSVVRRPSESPEAAQTLSDLDGD